MGRQSSDKIVGHNHHTEYVRDTHQTEYGETLIRQNKLRLSTDRIWGDNHQTEYGETIIIQNMGRQLSDRIWGDNQQTEYGATLIRQNMGK
jgi:hypothetical protein